MADAALAMPVAMPEILELLSQASDHPIGTAYPEGFYLNGLGGPRPLIIQDTDILITIQARIAGLFLSGLAPLSREAPQRKVVAIGPRPSTTRAMAGRASRRRGRHAGS